MSYINYNSFVAQKVLIIFGGDNDSKTPRIRK